MSEEPVMEQPITDAAPPVVDGGSFLTEVATAPTPEPPPAAEGSAEEAIDEAISDGQRPDYIPEKFWDPNNRMAKIEDMGKSYINLEKLMSSQDRITLPTDDDDEEGHTRLYEALRPESEERYDFGERPELPEGLPYDEESEQSYRNWAWQNGLSAKQARGLYDGFVKRQIEAHASYAKARQEQRTQLDHAMQREYGQALPAALTRAKSTMQKFGDPDFVQYLNETGLGNDPRMIRFAERIGKEMNGETRLTGRQEGQAQPEDIQSAIASFNAKHEKALFDRSHPDHQRLVKERSRMFEALYTESA